jgi:hypothetical protein
MRLDIAIRQIEFARKYTLGLIADMEPADWFETPAGCVTHLAWQIGHLAMAQYGLCLFRIRGRRAEDLQLMSSDFRKKYSRGSVPNPDPAANAAPSELLAILDRVHAQALKELNEYSDEQLDVPGEEPLAVFTTRLGSIYFCSTHEMIHAGQIGLLRRLLGRPPVR